MKNFMVQRSAFELGPTLTTRGVASFSRKWIPDPPTLASARSMV